jgi:hypothetical protein
MGKLADCFNDENYFNKFIKSFRWARGEDEDISKNEKNSILITESLLDEIYKIYETKGKNKTIATLSKSAMIGFDRISKYIKAGLRLDGVAGLPAKSNWLDILSPKVVFAWKSKSGELDENILKLLTLLSSYRLFSNEKTMWEIAKQAPKNQEAKALLGLLKKIELPVHGHSFNSAVLVLIVKKLAGKLLNSKGELHPVLSSDAYRKVLWENIDTVMWREIIGSGYETLVPGARFPDDGEYGSTLSKFWLIAEYGYLVLGIDRRLRIYEHFRQAMRNELLLYQSREGYRDHLFHVMNTFLLGMGLLFGKNGLLEKIFKGSSSTATATKSRKTTNELRRNWFLASLCHDFGYVMDIMPSTLKLTEYYESKNISSTRDRLGDAWERQISQVNQKIKEEAKLKNDLGKRCDHGIFSYLHLRRIIKQLDTPQANSNDDDFSKSKNYEDYADALGAVARHNLFEEPVVLEKMPLAGALIVCDELQDWHRPRFDMPELTESIMSLINLQKIQAVQRRKVCEPVEVGQLEKGSLDFKKGSGPVKIVLRYTDQNVNVYEPIGHLLSKIYNLERIEGIDKINMILEIWIPTLTGEGKGSVREMDILRDFCLLCESAYVNLELFTLGKTKDAYKKQRCTYYRRQGEINDREYDVIMLNLTKFPKKPRTKPLVMKDPWTFEEQLWEFKKSYCRRKNVRCVFLENENDWPIRQISLATSIASID